MLNIGDVAHQNSGSEVPVSNPASTNPDVLQGYCEILHRGKPTPEAKKKKKTINVQYCFFGQLTCF